MNAGFDPQEAREMLGLSYAIDLLGTHGAPPKQRKPTNDPQNPIPDDDGKTYPYPIAPIWPSGWTPAFTSNPTSVWDASILTPKPFLGLLGTNNVLITYNESRNAYAVAFAGTQNLLGGIEDVGIIPVYAGKVDGKRYTSETEYITNPSYYPDSVADGQPKVIQPLMHLGFRMAVEQFTVKAKHDKFSLIKLFQSLGKSEIDLYVTGHSLGGAMAGVFSAWIQATGIEGMTINLKTYTYASPKIGNDSFVNNFDAGATQKGMAFRCFNNLDTVPQIPPTWESFSDLNNPEMVTGILKLIWSKGESVLPKSVQKWLDKIKLPSLDLPNFNYCHVGSPIPLHGSFPVETTDTEMPAKYFPNGMSAPESISNTQKVWWQHWPWVYYEALEAAYPSA